MTQTVKNLPVMQETWVKSLDPKNTLEKRMATKPSILAWRIPWTEEPGMHGVAKSRAMTEQLSTHRLLEVIPDAKISSVQFSSVTQSCLTLCDPMNRSTPGLPVHQQLPESSQTHVHQVGDAIQPSHPLSSPSPPVPNPSQHQGLFQ